MILVRPKYGQVDLEVIERAQQGDRRAMIEVFNGYKNLLHKVLHQRGITPQAVGRAQYNDAVGDLQVVFFERVLPAFDPTAGTAFSTWMYTVLNNEVSVWRRRKQFQKYKGKEVSFEEPLGGEEGEGMTLHEITPDISTTGVNPFIQLMIDEAKQYLDPIHKLILDYVLMGYNFREITKLLNRDYRFKGEEARFTPQIVETIKQSLSPTDQIIFEDYLNGYESTQIAQRLQRQQIAGPRGEQFDDHAVSVRLSQVIRPLISKYVKEGTFNAPWVKRQWNNIILPLLERIFPEEIRRERWPLERKRYQKYPAEVYPAEPAYRIHPETGERTLIEPTAPPAEASQRLSLRKTAVIDVVTFLRIHLDL